MARPRSEDKHHTILQAATRLFAEEGLGAPTSRIAKLAGVAEGTIFLYFATKDVLLNQLYLALKSELRLSFALSPASTELRERVWQFWTAYVSWGLQHPAERVALSKLESSARVTPATRAIASESFHDVIDLLMEAMALGVMSKQPPAFIGAFFVAVAEATIDFISANAGASATTSADSFAGFWLALTGH